MASAFVEAVDGPSDPRQCGPTAVTNDAALRLCTEIVVMSCVKTKADLLQDYGQAPP